MAIVQNTYTGNGSTTIYSLSFSYLDKADVKVTVNNVLVTNYIFATASSIQFSTAPSAGASIRIYRDTDTDQTKATFFAGSAIKAKDLNSNFTQTLYAVQEIAFSALSKIGDTMQGILNMGGFRITNLGTPAADADGATKKYVDDRFGDIEIPGVTRWRKTATAGQTTFSGGGDYGGTLAYSASRETVYVNGALQQRNVDYTADNGTSIVFTPALVLGDVVDVHCVNNAAGITTDQASGVYWAQGGTGAITRTVDSKLKDVVSVKDFGAVGDGVTNDTDAFAAASARINALGGGTLVIPPGTYIIGKQTFAGAFGLGYAYAPSTVLSFNGCTKPVSVLGCGAILKFASGLKFGSFNPVTGAVHSPSLPFTNYDYVAAVGNAIAFINCASVTVEDLEIDGNIANLTLGGLWGDTGRQIAAYGLYAYGNKNFQAKNIYTHHHGLDGVVIGYAGLTETSDYYPHVLANVRSEYNARQGLSWVGGSSLTAIGCAFNYTGRSTFSSAPTAGLDIEAESSVCRNGLFLNCEFKDNVGLGVVADSGDSANVTFINCKVVGTTNYATWTRKPRFVFQDCLIAGTIVNPHGSATDPASATKYIRCTVTDEVSFGGTPYGNYLIDTGGADNAFFDSCRVVSTRSKLCYGNNGIFQNCQMTLTAGTGFIVNQGEAAVFQDATLIDNTFIENITTNPPADAYYIYAPNAKCFGRNLITSPNSKLYWNSWSLGAGAYKGYKGVFPNNETTQPFLTLFKGLRADPYYGVIYIGADTAAPTTGTWRKGDRVLNNEPAVGSPKGWICTVAGTPGTWVSEGNL